MKTLFIAAGGGGDAVGALMVSGLLARGEDGPLLIATCAWERLMVDPVPGPRPPSGFVGLGAHSEVLAHTETLPAGRSMLPRLAAESHARIFLLDLEGGVVALADQLRDLAEAVKADRFILVDVGGDAVALGPERNLLSPLCDSMSVAAAVLSGVPSRLAVVGPGSDGELTEHEVLARLRDLNAVRLGSLESSDVAPLEIVLRWHPTEASAIVAAAAKGARVRVAMRRGGSPRSITDHATEVWLVDLAPGQLPLADVVAGSRSLEEAADVMAERATNELAFEREKARLAGGPIAPNLGALEDDVKNGATHVTLRRARELTGAATPVGTFGSVVLEHTDHALLRISLRHLVG